MDSKVTEGVWLLPLALIWLVPSLPGPPMLSGVLDSKLDGGLLSSGSGVCKHCKVFPCANLTHELRAND